MNVGFDEVKKIFNDNVEWVDLRDLLWYRKAWTLLEKEELTTYKNPIERTIVLIRVFTLIMIFKEYVCLANEEDMSYEFIDWQEYSGISEFRVGQIITMIYPNEKYLNFEDDYSAVNSAFTDLVINERSKVMNAIFNNIGENPKGRVLAAMYLAWLGMNENEDDEFDYYELSELEKYENYERSIDEYLSAILKENPMEIQRAYPWLSGGTHIIQN